MMEYFANNNEGVDSLDFSPKIGGLLQILLYSRDGLPKQSYHKERKKERRNHQTKMNLKKKGFTYSHIVVRPNKCVSLARRSCNYGTNTKI